MQFTQLASPHEAGVNDVAFDYYGKRLASCSSDKRIKIYDFIEKSREWDIHDISRAHDGVIWRLSWAHPEFGQILASCSEDQTVHIYEEQESVSTRSDGKESKWLRKAQLLDSQKAVKDVKFAPRHDGLKLAAASAEGVVRIYTADDIFNLNIWTLQDTLKIYPVENVAGGDSESSEHGLTCCSWNDSPFEPAKLVLGGYAKRVSIWTCDSANKWKQECVLEESEFVIHDVAWAPSMGRTYHLIASANRTNVVTVHRVKRLNNGSVEPGSNERLECPSPV